MDAFGAWRRAKDLPAISLQWGPWAEVGMAARAGTSEGQAAEPCEGALGSMGLVKGNYPLLWHSFYGIYIHIYIYIYIYMNSGWWIL